MKDKYYTVMYRSIVGGWYCQNFLNLLDAEKFFIKMQKVKDYYQIRLVESEKIFEFTQESWFDKKIGVL